MARKKRTGKAASTADDVRPPTPEAGAGGEVIVRLPPKLGKRLGEVLAITDRFCDDHLSPGRGEWLLRAGLAYRRRRRRRSRRTTWYAAGQDSVLAVCWYTLRVKPSLSVCGNSRHAWGLTA